MSEDRAANVRGLWNFPGLALLLTAIMLALAYPGMSLLRELLGQRGFATSPLLLSPVTLTILALMIWREPWVQARPYWPRIERYWSAFGVGIGMVVPVVLGVVWPVAVLERLPRAIPTLVSLLPMALVYYLFYRMGVAAKAHLRELRRHEGDNKE